MQLAQINIAKMKGPIDSPVMKEFVDNLDRINETAEQSQGFIWRLKDDKNNATSINVFDDDYLIVNMSVWENMQCLFNFVYRSDHMDIFKRRKEWFGKMKEMHMVNWYIRNDRYPSVEEAVERLEYIRRVGETPYAFTFKSKYTIQDLRGYLSVQQA